MSTKVLFTDLDGTLLDDKKGICSWNQAVIKAMLAKGHKLIITSGRSLKSVEVQAKKLNLLQSGCHLIAFNGGMLYDAGEKRLLRKQAIPVVIAKKIAQIADDYGIYVHTYDQKQVIAQTDGEIINRYSREMNADYKLVPSIADALEEAPCKLVLIDYERHDLLERARKTILNEVGQYIDAFFSDPIYLEIVPKGVSKGKAVLDFCKQTGIPLEDTVAVGDALNDMDMIQNAFVGAVMKNGQDPVKAVADYVTQHDNNAGGVAEVIEKFIL